MTGTSKTIVKVLQWAVRLLLLAAALFLAAGGPVPVALGRLFPQLSPLVAVTSSIAQRRWYLGAFWFAPPLAALLLAVWKGRLFCRWICPAGTVYTLGSKATLRRRVLKVRLNGYLFWTIVSASLVGVPLLAALDPLSTFNRLTTIVTGTYTVASLIPGLLVPAMLVLGVIQPMVWCSHLCPLGYFFEISRSFRSRPKEAFVRSRRQIVTGLLVGLPLGALTRAFALGKGRHERPPVLPPGATGIEAFSAACTRCYACVDACPYGLIRVRFDTDRAAWQLFEPEVHYLDSELAPDCGYCPEWCNACSQVCPAGAITPLSLADKQCRQIGVAKVIREACLAWEDGEDCSVCQEVCPYQAITLKIEPDGRALPIVDEDICRGCGACFSNCPAQRKGKAIIVGGVDRQRQVRPM